MTPRISHDYDVAIVGAGPAGSSSAIRLAQAGLKVLLVEQKQFPRAKLCGEFISPECLTHFAELGVLERMTFTGSNIARTVFYAQNGRSLIVPNEWFSAGSTALGLSRAEMDKVLLDRARAAGAEVMANTQATGLLFDDSDVVGLEVRDEDRRSCVIRSKITLDATGRSRALVRYVDRAHNRSAKKKRAPFVAFKVHLNDADVGKGNCEIYAYPGGYGGCVRVEKGLHNLCFIVPSDTAKLFGGNAADIMQKVVLKNRRAASSLRKATVADEWLAVPIESYGRAQLAPAHGLLTVGDAAAFIDPFTGSGILLALESAKIVADVIGEMSSTAFAKLSGEYKHRYADAFNKRLLVSSLIRHAAFAPFIAEAVIRTLAMSEGLTKTLARATRRG